ncbi:MAG: FHA domain-containing protein [Armatimonadota bacterium]|nr:FHA domain-containing protein [Armatimonadota bacterium]
MYNSILRRMVRLSLAGLISGLVSFAVIEPFMNDEGTGGYVSAFLESALLFGVLGLVISLGIVIGEELDSGALRRITNRGLKGACAGILGGFLAGYLGQLVFSILLLLKYFIGDAAVVISRASGWALVGGVIGAASGIAANSNKKALLGATGGFIGGGAGGFVFDLASGLAESGAPGRLIGFAAVGLMTGLAIALVEEIAKRAWIVVLSGRNEGKQYILTKAQTRIGRDELADIPLFGDQGVAKLHAAVEAAMGGYIFVDHGGNSLVNNQPAQRKTLVDGDSIKIGRFALSFRTKGSPRSAVLTTPAVMTGASQATSVIAQKPNVMPRLRVIAGPYAGSCFDILEYNISIGREVSNIIALPRDSSVSRRHASLSYENGKYILRDAGSANGTFMRGSRITEVALAPGDTFQVGATYMTLVFE